MSCILIIFRKIIRWWFGRYLTVDLHHLWGCQWSFSFLHKSMSCNNVRVFSQCHGSVDNSSKSSSCKHWILALSCVINTCHQFKIMSISFCWNSLCNRISVWCCLLTHKSSRSRVDWDPWRMGSCSPPSAGLACGIWWLSFHFVSFCLLWFCILSGKVNIFSDFAKLKLVVNIGIIWTKYRVSQNKLVSYCLKEQFYGSKLGRNMWKSFNMTW